MEPQLPSGKQQSHPRQRQRLVVAFVDDQQQLTRALERQRELERRRRGRRVAVFPDGLRELLEGGLSPPAVGRTFDAELDEAAEHRSGRLQLDDGTGKTLEWQRDRVERPMAGPILHLPRLWRRRPRLEGQRQSLVEPFEQVRDLRVAGVHDADVGKAARGPLGMGERRRVERQGHEPWISRRERTLIPESRRIHWCARLGHVRRRRLVDLTGGHAYGCRQDHEMSRKGEGRRHKEESYVLFLQFCLLPSAFSLDELSPGLASTYFCSTSDTSASAIARPTSDATRYNPPSEARS